MFHKHYNEGILAKLEKLCFNKSEIHLQFQKISILPPQKGLEFPGGRGFYETIKNF